MGSDDARREYVHGFVRGTSMWPGLVPGDLLRARRIRADGVAKGDILVIVRAGVQPVVHRVVLVEPAGEGGLLLRTSGDRSGPDTVPLTLRPDEELLRLEGVLRLGTWRRIPRRAPAWLRKLPENLVRLHCLFVRKLLWGGPAALTAGGREISNWPEGESRTRKGG